jgi:hypothetical protein
VYGRRDPADRLSCDVVMAGPVTVATLIQAADAPRAGAVDAKIADGGPAIGIEWGPGARETLRWDAAGGSLQASGGHETAWRWTAEASEATGRSH